MNLKKTALMVLAGIMLLGMPTGCGSPQKTEDPSADHGKKASGTSDSADTTADSGKEKPYEGVTITFLKDADTADDGINAVAALAKERLGLTVEVEQRVGGADGDNIVKTRLASGDMADICLYNSGSLLNALNPSEYFYDLSDQDFVATYDDTYKETVTVDEKVYGVPVSSTQAGAILYYKPDYEELGLSVPDTWDEFISNCKKLKEAGKTAMIGTFGDSWTSQACYLGDNYNVIADNPSFAEDFESGKVKFASTPAGVESFQKLLDVQPFYNEDYLAATYDDGCEMLANGDGTHWIMLTQALGNIYSLYPESIDDIGVFGIPGNDPNNMGLTVWEPVSLYVNKNAENVDAVLDFMRIYVSTEGLDAYSGVVKADGPYCIKGYELPEDAYPAVKEDMQKYFDDGKTCTALEFMTSVKGSNCPAICQEVGSGQTTAEAAATAYDEDCKKQAVQLGLNWD